MNRSKKILVLIIACLTATPLIWFLSYGLIALLIEIFDPVDPERPVMPIAEIIFSSGITLIVAVTGIIYGIVKIWKVE
jgi:hypothetical protein